MDRIIALRVALLVAAALLALFGIGNAFVAIFIQGRYEVTWNYDESVRFCTAGTCIYSADLAIANTGTKPQRRAVVELVGLPPSVRASRSILNLSASEPRDADPTILESRTNASLQITLDQFQPGTLVLMRLSGFYPEAELPNPPEVAASVDAQGRIIEGDPRAITLGRYLTQSAARENTKHAGHGSGTGARSTGPR